MSEDHQETWNVNKYNTERLQEAEHNEMYAGTLGHLSASWFLDNAND